MSRANQDWGYPLASHKQEKAHQSHVEGEQEWLDNKEMPIEVAHLQVLN